VEREEQLQLCRLRRLYRVRRRVPRLHYEGAMGPECGPFVNMSAPYFTQVACGFAGKPPGQPDGSWAVQNFQ
jgi:hypothetical protein